MSIWVGESSMPLAASVGAAPIVNHVSHEVLELIPASAIDNSSQV